MVLFIHDEVIFEVEDTPEMKEKYFRIVKDAMENPPLKETFGVELGVPLIAECKIGYNLYDMEDYNPWENQSTK
jgi:DNA polymerase I-like protein with 3'-5' exonuclease and polymerase domains